MNPIEIVRRTVEERGQAQTARDLGISVSYLCNMMKGRADPGPLVLDALGIEKVVTYRLKAEANG